jgi:hypothetical protein
VASLWDSFSASVKVVGLPTTYPPAACQESAKRLGLSCFPPSYCEYVQRYGYGEWQEDLFICVPSHPSLVGSVEELANDLESVFWECWAQHKETKDAARMARLVHFASTTMAFSFAWDPEDVRNDGELGIYIVAFPEVLEYCCHDLLVFLRDYWIGGKINDVYLFEGGARWVTGPVFTAERPSPPLGRPKTS